MNRKSLLSIFLATALMAGAVPAKRGFRTYTQPDGSTVTLELRGDEHSHYFLTEDHVPVLEDASGAFRYAEVADNGDIVLSKYMARDAGRRSADERRFAETLSPAVLSEALQANAVRRSARAAAAAQSRTAAQSGLGLYTSNYPRKGKIHTLVFLVQYQDVAFKVNEPHDFFTRMLNQEGFSDYNGTGSARDYFTYQSGGQFDVTFDVFGPMTLANSRSYYGGNDSYGDDKHPEEMALEAAEAFKNQIDYSQYDYDNDGKIDNIYVIYAGMGEASGGGASTVWPHSWEISNGPKYNGKQVFSYTCSNEWENGVPDGIGTLVHEYSHVLGLPDLYDTNYSYDVTPGAWSVLDYGPYNNDGRTPPNYGVFERNAMQWLDPIVLDGPATIELDAIDLNNKACLIPTEKTNEFFLLENRQQQGWDTYLPYHGMLIWHIDFNQTIWDRNVVNNTKSHQYVDIEEANGNPNSSSYTAMKGYPFPGTSNKTSFTSTTSPALKTWGNKAVNLPITDIEETADGIIRFNVAGGKIDLATPAAPELTAADNGTVAIKWQAVEQAKEYYINVWHLNDLSGVVYDYADYVATGTECVLDGFVGLTKYYATVTAVNGPNHSEASPVAEITTPALSLQYAVPVLTYAKYNRDGTMHLEWDAIDGADSYLLTVAKVLNTGASTVTVDFDGDATVTIPEDWTWDGSTSKNSFGASSTNYYGASAPSLRFSSDGESLTSPFFAGDVQKVEFWTRGASAAGTSALHILGRLTDLDSFQEIYTINPMSEYNSAGAMVEFTPATAVKQIRFTYEKFSGNCALDDITITVPGFSAIEGYDGLDLGNVTEHTSNVGIHEGALRVSLVAVNSTEGTMSRPSTPLDLTADNTEGIADASVANDSDAEWFNLQGVRIAAPSQAGIYLRRCGSVTSKVIVK